MPGFQMIVDDVFSITGVGKVVCGRIKEGSVRVGDKLHAHTQSGAYSVVVQSIETADEPLSQARAGQDVGIHIEGEKADQISRGDILTDSQETL